MSINEGGPAFPYTGTGELPNGHFDHSTGGMTLRDYFAAKAMQGMLAACGDKTDWPHQSVMASASCAWADAMLKARTDGSKQASVSTDPIAKALSLVTEYARLQDFIHATRERIGSCLELCPGVNGNRKEVEHFASDEFMAACDVPTQRAQIDETHLSAWYRPDQDNEGNTVWCKPDAEECPHCFAAHEVVQERRRAKRALGSVKGQMRKLGRRAAASLTQPKEPTNG